jgi:hypothetical protein
MKAPPSRTENIYPPYGDTFFSAGFFGPSIVGWVTDWTKRSDYGLYLVAAAMVFGANLVLLFGPRKNPVVML